MDTYSLLREFADSWVLLFLTLVFLAVFVWAWRPGSRATHDDIAQSIFRHDLKPAAVASQTKEA
ncbi:cytochrome oxidase [Cypionkella aquatica]|uniref:Cytochrome oxidase n=1 Tax=Cypionkella aquatica TaxID=1756042 RepID=A0AA37TQE5_9RHOB|nr:cbb3-type cytochrome c oxidase subunit 3 [Cypionkella aquatica]GLS85732.1 cytochrome oxidase [Cypionkella aquatica]